MDLAIETHDLSRHFGELRAVDGIDLACIRVAAQGVFERPARPRNAQLALAAAVVVGDVSI